LCRARQPPGDGRRRRRRERRAGARPRPRERDQGVYYRANARETAREAGLDGWVRNLDDGRVEAVFEGPRDAVESAVEWCERGSPAARVERVTVEYGPPEGLDGFRIRR
jgi:acylphosphatase